MVLGLELDSKLFCLDGELAAHGVLDVEHGWVEVVDGEGLHGVFETEEVGADEEVGAGADADEEEERMEEREGEGVVLDAMVIRSVTIYFRW